MPSETMKLDYTGSCLCGSVQWHSTASPTMQFNCYCIDCRKSTGAAFVPIMFFRAEDLTLTGNLTHFDSTGGSGHPIHRAFCARCGAQVAADAKMVPGTLSIRAGTLDNINLFSPCANIFVAHAPDWASPPQGLPSFAQLPRSRKTTT